MQNLTLSIDIPSWFDVITYSSKYGSGNLAEWIFKNIKNVTIMAYRDKALGSDGIVNIVKS